MGQEQVIDYLKQQKKWVTAKQVAEDLGLCRSSASENLRKIMKRNNGIRIKCEPRRIKKKQGLTYFYKYVGEGHGDEE
jgi:predicted transcriptional regulator